MAAVAGVPGLSALLSWPTEHLTEAAAHWENVGDRSYGVAHGVWSDALGVDWSGETADALRTDTHADLMTTSGVVDQLQEAAGVARSGASELDAARSQVRYAVEDARSAGFKVGEDLSVTDRMTGGSAAQMAARQAAAQAHAASIGGRAAQLIGVDTQVASKVTAAVAGIGSTFPQTPATSGQVHAVDNRTFKQGPGAPPPPPPKGPSAADIRKVIEKLPEGRSDDIREVRTPEDLQNLKRWMTEHGVDIESHYPDPDMGHWKRLPDGNEVGERNTAKSTGQKALDIDLKRPDGTKEHWKIHINPKTGGLPEFPATEAVPAEAAPAEAAPAEQAPIEGIEGGGPAGIPVTPHFIHPPGSVEHGAPIIGEDDPGEDPRDFKN